MDKRCQQMARLLARRFSRERLCQQRLAICQRFLRWVQAQLGALRDQGRVLLQSPAPALPAAIEWHQERQLALAALNRHQERLERVRMRLTQRVKRRQMALRQAARLRCTAEATLLSMRQEWDRAAARAEQKQADDLVRTRLRQRAGDSHAPAT